ncbi:MAG: DUF4178 domain-containing protein [Bryobacteraceae bacterium]
MSTPSANCPSCGAPVVFRWSGSVQTVCPFCKSILVRTDIDLTKVGAVADLWNEWHVVYNDGVSGWLSDAQLEYDVSWQVQSPPPPNAFPQTPVRGQQFNWSGRIYQVTSITKAHYKGVEGELPFQYWDKADALFADLRTSDEQFGTIDYTENPPLLFLGRAIDFKDLHLKNLREFEGWRQ